MDIDGKWTEYSRSVEVEVAAAAELASSGKTVSGLITALDYNGSGNNQNRSSYNGINHNQRVPRRPLISTFNDLPTTNCHQNTNTHTHTHSRTDLTRRCRWRWPVIVYRQRRLFVVGVDVVVANVVFVVLAISARYHRATLVLCMHRPIVVTLVVEPRRNQADGTKTKLKLISTVCHRVTTERETTRKKRAPSVHKWCRLKKVYTSLIVYLFAVSRNSYRTSWRSIRVSSVQISSIQIISNLIDHKYRYTTGKQSLLAATLKIRLD